MSNLKIGPVDITGGTATLSNGGFVVGNNNLKVNPDGAVSMTSAYFPTTGGCVVTNGVDGDGSTFLNILGDSGKNRGVFLHTGNNLRWGQYVDSSTETGTEAGSNYTISRYNDTGGYLDNPMSISRASGVATFVNGVKVPTRSAGDNTEYAASTAFVLNAINTLGAGVTSFNTRTGAVTLTNGDVLSAVGSIVNTFNGRSGAVNLTSGDVTSALGYAPTNSSGAVSFTSAGTYYWTAPNGVTTVLVSGCAGGGGFAKTFIPNKTTQGGNGQYCYQIPISVTPGTVYTITVGDVGVNSNVISSPTSGGAGGITSFGTLLTLTGGGGGWIEDNGTTHDGAGYAAMGSSPTFNNSTGAMFGQGTWLTASGTGDWYTNPGTCGFITFTW